MKELFKVHPINGRGPNYWSWSDEYGSNNYPTREQAETSLLRHLYGPGEGYYPGWGNDEELWDLVSGGAA